VKDKVIQCLYMFSTDTALWMWCCRAQYCWRPTGGFSCWIFISTTWGCGECWWTCQWSRRH